MQTRIFGRIWLGVLLAGLGGCSTPYGAPGYPGARPMVAPTVGPAPIYQPTVSAPVALTPQTTASIGDSLPQVQAKSVVQLPTSTGSLYHEVNAGETLSSIATRYGMTAEQLRTANGLNANASLTPGQRLMIR